MDNDEFEGILKNWHGQKLSDLESLLGLDTPDGEAKELHVRFSYISPSEPMDYRPYFYQTQEYTFSGDMTEYGIDLIRKMFGGHMSMDDVRQAMEENCEPAPKVVAFTDAEVKALQKLKQRVERGDVARG